MIVNKNYNQASRYVAVSTKRIYKLKIQKYINS